jgi:hypothetical protein
MLFRLRWSSTCILKKAYVLAVVSRERRRRPLPHGWQRRRAAGPSKVDLTESPLPSPMVAAAGDGLAPSESSGAASFPGNDFLCLPQVQSRLSSIWRHGPYICGGSLSPDRRWHSPPSPASTASSLPFWRVQGWKTRVLRMMAWLPVLDLACPFTRPWEYA